MCPSGTFRKNYLKVPAGFFETRRLYREDQKSVSFYLAIRQSNNEVMNGSLDKKLIKRYIKKYNHLALEELRVFPFPIEIKVSGRKIQTAMDSFVA